MSLKDDIREAYIFAGEGTLEEALADYKSRYYADNSQSPVIGEIQDKLRHYYGPGRKVADEEAIETVLGFFTRTLDPPLPGLKPFHHTGTIRRLNLQLTTARAFLTYFQNEVASTTPPSTTEVIFHGEKYQVPDRPSSEKGALAIQKDLATASGIPFPTVKRWYAKYNDAVIRPKYFPALINTFWPPDRDLSNDDRYNIKRFLVDTGTISISADEPWREEWLDKKIAQRNLLDIAFPAFCPYWLEMQTFKDEDGDPLGPEKTQHKKAGLLLDAMKEYWKWKHDTQESPTSIHHATITGWVTGEYPIDRNKLGGLIQVMEPFPEQIKHLALLVIPELNTSVGKAWLDEQVKAGNWSNDTFSAINDSFRAVLPPALRAGWLLHDLREMAGLTVEELSEQKLGLGRTASTQWELGINGLHQNMLVLLIKALHPSPKNLQSFITEVVPELNTPEGRQWIDEQAIAVGDDLDKWNELLSFKNDTFRNFFPARLRAGLLLRELASDAGKDVPQLADAIGLSLGRMFDRLNGNTDIDPSQFKEALNLFEGTEEERPADNTRFSYKKFVEVAEATNKAAPVRNISKIIIGRYVGDYKEVYKEDSSQTIERRRDIIANIFYDLNHIPEQHLMIQEQGKRAVVQAITDMQRVESFGRYPTSYYNYAVHLEVVEATLSAIELDRKYKAVVDYITRIDGQELLALLSEAGTHLTGASAETLSQSIDAEIGESWAEGGSLSDYLAKNGLSIEHLYWDIVAAGVPREDAYLTHVENAADNIKLLQTKEPEQKKGAAGVVFSNVICPKGVSDIAIAKQIGMDEATVKNWRRGRAVPDEDVFEKVRTRLGFCKDDPVCVYYEQIAAISRVVMRENAAPEREPGAHR